MSSDLREGLQKWQARAGPASSARAEQQRFYDFCDLHGLPDTPEAIALYLVYVADSRQVSVGAIRYRLRLLDLAAVLKEQPPPSRDNAVRLLMRGMHRELATGLDQNRTPLYLEDVDAMLHAVDRDRHNQLRDAAFLLLVDTAPLPVNLLRQLRWDQIRLRRDHLELTIPAQRGAHWTTGRVRVAARPGPTCPVRVLTDLSRYVGPANAHAFACRAGEPLSMKTAELLLAEVPARGGIWRSSSRQQPSAGDSVLLPLLDKLLADRPKQVRDRALITLAFAGCLNPDDARELTVRDVEQVSNGLVLHLKGRNDVGIPRARVPARCPVSLWATWRRMLVQRVATADLAEHFAFPRIQQDFIRNECLHGAGLTWTVRKRTDQAGLVGYYGFTSLRHGFMRTAARAGVPEQLICQQAGLRRLNSALLHVRREQLLRVNAAGLVGL